MNADMFLFGREVLKYVLYLQLLSHVTSYVVNYTIHTPAMVFKEFDADITTSTEKTPYPKEQHRDVIAEFLEIVEKYERNKENCTAGTQFNLGQGVIQQYGKNRFRQQALIAVTRANFLTRLWMKASPDVLNSEFLLYTQVRSIVEGDPLIFAGGNCHDKGEYKNYYIFCPYAYRTENGQVNVKDLSVEYNYLGNDSEWFYMARMRASKLENFNYTGEPSMYDIGFNCLPCAPGCDTCEDSSPCIITLNWLQRSIILGISGLIMCCIPALVWFTVQYKDVKVLKAASPVLLRIVLLGAFLLYCPLVVGYFEASVLTCCLRFWFREIGFSISYGALLLKTWRISVVFRVRSAQRIKISDADLIKRLIAVVLIFAAYLTARTVAGTPRVVEGRHVGGLKAFQCSSDWWDHAAAIGELLFLIWGIRLCIVVRKAPSEFNESRFISWAIYNETLLSLFLNVSMIFLQDPFPANPDLLYLVIFIHANLSTTVTLTFLFGSKAYLVYKYHGKNQNEVQHTTMVTKGSKHTYGPKSPTLATDNNTTNANSSYEKYGDKQKDAGELESLLEKDIQEEFRRLYTQLELLKQRNMKIGNRHLQHKLSAMTEAAQKEDSPDSTPTSPNMNGKRVVINLDDYHESTTL
ncbi:hypothetical protein ACJMK2_009389 [Sinanodonta woodiana]|uniref:G-protein coupled receptors family 3 profile domain-containing protein n=1 Tax=Sinanodonta woodiana TaxID=1069815 RepID=A0ABD3VC55_SINWO